MKETKKEKCPFCGCELTAENSVVFDGVVMCRDCLGEQTVICADCGQRIWSEAAYDVNGNTVCEHCYDDYYTCSGCGRLVYRDDVYYDDDDNAYCNNCYEHTCKESGCYNQKGYGSDYCTDHQVDMRKKLGNEFSFSVNSAGGIKLNFRTKNNSGKEIQYIRFDVEFRNAVGDKIQDEITDKYSVSVEVVGPIASGKSANFEDIIGYNDNCARIDIMKLLLYILMGLHKLDIMVDMPKKID